jgi:hypothetical protein
MISETVRKTGCREVRRTIRTMRGTRQMARRTIRRMTRKMIRRIVMDGEKKQEEMRIVILRTSCSERSGAQDMQREGGPVFGDNKAYNRKVIM